MLLYIVCGLVATPWENKTIVPTAKQYYFVRFCWLTIRYIMSNIAAGVDMDIDMDMNISNAVINRRMTSEGIFYILRHPEDAALITEISNEIKSVCHSYLFYDVTGRQSPKCHKRAIVRASHYAF